MKKAMIVIISLILIPVIVMGGAYVSLASYYKNNFSSNTWINGVYCTGKSAEEVNRSLMEQTQVPTEAVVTGYVECGSDLQNEYKIPLSRIDFAETYEAQIEEILEGQDAWNWGADVFKRRESHLETEISFDEDKLRQWVQDYAKTLNPKEQYKIVYSEGSGYTLSDGYRNRLDEEKAFEYLKAGLLGHETVFDLCGAECFYSKPLSEEQKEVEALWQKIDAYQNNGLKYNFGEGPVTIPGEVFSSFIEKDENNMPIIKDGSFVVDEKKIEAWVKDMAAEHDTNGKVWEFQSTRGELVEVKGVTYGTTMDTKREASWLTGYVLSLADGEFVVPVDVRIPEYSKDAYNHSTTEIGDTYIEVDMGIQKLYYYENGSIKLQTDVVSGCVNRRMSTPEGVNYVYSKQKNRILRGENYATPVKFWMPVKGAIGIHDADWRSKFGGEIYKRDGSHGCVNVPKDVMPTLYDMVEVGTPVIMFYGEDPYAPKEEDTKL